MKGLFYQSSNTGGVINVSEKSSDTGAKIAKVKDQIAKVKDQVKCLSMEMFQCWSKDMLGHYLLVLSGLQHCMEQG